MDNYRPSTFSFLPEVVKNLLIINGLFYLATVGFETMGIDLHHLLGMHYFESSLFRPHQMITYMFMHGSIGHLIFNMFALWMFGSAVENYWGPKKFLIYYLITGLGAAILHYVVVFFHIRDLLSIMDPEAIQQVYLEGAELLESGRNYTDPLAGALNSSLNMPLVGASGSVFGLLLAFGMLFPNSLIYVYFFFPIKAKHFVMLYGAMELFSGLSNDPYDNVAHFAHLGGMLFGWLLIRYWANNRRHSGFN